jgi:hypothetical protein
LFHVVSSLREMGYDAILGGAEVGEIADLVNDCD